MTPRILVIEFPPDQNGVPRCVFAREDDGMCIGSAYAGRGTFGEADPALTRNFIDQEHAIRWVKQKCREMLERDDVDFISQEPPQQHIVVPTPRIAMPKGRM